MSERGNTDEGLETSLEKDAFPSLLPENISGEHPDNASTMLAENTNNPNSSDQETPMPQDRSSPQPNETVSETSNLPNFSLLHLESPETSLLDSIQDEETPPEGRIEDTEQPVTDQASNSRDQRPINEDSVETDAEPINQGDQNEPSNVIGGCQEPQPTNVTPTSSRETQIRLVDATPAESPEIIYERGEKKHDIALVFDEQDEEVADNILEEMAKLSVDGEKIDVHHFNDVIFGSNIVDWPQKICNSCLLVFVVQTKKPPQDSVRNFLKDEMVAKLRVIEGNDNIQSLMTCDGLEKLSGLTSLDGFRWYQTDKRRKKLQERIRHLRSAYNRGPSKPLDKLDGAAAGRIKQKRGMCIIVNNWKFTNTMMSDRLSARNQEVKVKDLFESRNFKVFSYCNQTHKEMTELLDGSSAEGIHSEFDCFVFYVMSHGAFDKILCHDGEVMQLSEQWKKFLPRNCESWRNKAKVFFFCSCRTGVASSDRLRDEYSDEDPEEMKDFFFCYSCQRGCKAFKSIEKDRGDVFTEEFLEAMKENQGMEFLALMDIVRDKVKERSQYVSGEEHNAIPETKTISTIRLVL